MKTFSIKTAFILSILLISEIAYGQEKKPDKPVKNTFQGVLLMNNQTVETLTGNTLQFTIQHRFGQINNGVSDLYGIFGPANIRIGLAWGLTPKLLVGIGGTKSNKLYDVEWKYRILQQTKSDHIPVSLTYFGNIAVNTTSNSIYKSFANRLSYFHTIMLARKFNRAFSAQVSGSVAHYNLVDSLMKNDNISIGVDLRYQYGASGAIIVEYNQPITKNQAINVKPDLGLGIELGTGGHVFQIFINTASGILSQQNTAYNTNDFTQGNMQLGFNIVRKWRF